LLKFVTKRLSTRVLACGLYRLQALEMLRALADTSLTRQAYESEGEIMPSRPCMHSGYKPAHESS
jgi:hypothetical protein